MDDGQYASPIVFASARNAVAWADNFLVRPVYASAMRALLDAERTGQAVAVDRDGGRITMDRLRAEAETISAHLGQLGASGRVYRALTGVLGDWGEVSWVVARKYWHGPRSGVTLEQVQAVVALVMQSERRLRHGGKRMPYSMMAQHLGIGRTAFYARWRGLAAEIQADLRQICANIDANLSIRLKALGIVA